MADSSDVKKLLRNVLDKLASLEREISTIKLDQRRLHDAVTVKAEKQAAYPMELRLPEFDGMEDPEVWLNRFETFFSLQRTEEDDKVNLAAFHMTGAAQIWYCGLKRTRGVPTWPQFAESVRRRYKAIVQLAHLHLNRSVAKNQDKFPMTEQELAAHFIAGLRDPQMRAELEERRPSTVDEAMLLALEVEHDYD